MSAPGDALVEWWHDQPLGGLPLTQLGPNSHVGDLLEPGEWYDGPIIKHGSRPAVALAPDATTMLVLAYRRAVPAALGMCGVDTCWHTRGRIGFCLLPQDHEPWRQWQRHRVYIFSPRDSAAMLAGMRRRLTEPMEEL